MSQDYRDQLAQMGHEQRGQLLENYRTGLLTLAERRMNRRLRTRVSAADIVQDSMLEAVRDWKSFRGVTEGEFHGWLRRILINNLSRAIERHVKTKKRDVRRDVSYFTCAAATQSRESLLRLEMVSTNDSPSTIVQRNENIQRLRALLADLPRDQQRVIELRCFHGMRFKEIGIKMNRSTSAAKMLWTRSIAKLKENADAGE